MNAISNHELQIKLTLKDETTKKLRGIKVDFQELRDKLQKNWMAISASMIGVGVALEKIIKNAVDYGVEIDKMSKMTGIAVDQFARLAYAAEQEHGSMEVLAKTFPVLAKAMGQAEDGLTTYRRSFEAMGIAWKDTTTGQLRPLKEVFLDIADYTQNAADKNEALQRVQEVLARGGKDLYDMLLLGREGIKKLGDEAERLGIIMDQQTVSDMEKYDDKIVVIKKNLQGLAITFTKELLPTLDLFATKLGDIQADPSGIIVAVKIAALTLSRIVLGVQATAFLIFNTFAQIAQGIIIIMEKMSLGLAKFPEFKEIMKGFGEESNTQLKAIAKNLKELEQLFGDGVPKAVEKAKEAVNRLAPSKEVYASWDIFFASMKEGLSEAQKASNNFSNSVKQGTMQLIKGMETQFGNFFYNTFTGQVGKARDIFADFGKSILQVLSQALAQWALFGFSGKGGLMSIVGFGPKKHQGGVIQKAHNGMAVGLPRLASDEVPIIAQSGEGVLSRRGMNAIGRNNFEQLNRGQGFSGGSKTTTIENNFNIAIQAVDARSFEQLLKQHPGVIQNQITDALRQNASFRAMLQRYG